jgi:hypothetical protein
MAQAPEASASPKGKAAKSEHHGQPAGAPEGAAPGAAQHAQQPATHQHGPPAMTPANAQGNQPQHGKAAGHNPHETKAEGGGAADVTAQPGSTPATGAPATGKQHGHGQNPQSTSPPPNAAAGKHNKNAPAATPAASAAAKSTPAPVASATPAAPSATPPKAAASSSPAAMKTAASPAAPAASPAASPAGAVAAQGTPRPNTPAATKKPAPQQVQQIKSQHASFRAQPRPEVVPPVQYNPGYRIVNAERWSGPQYEVYRSYHPERHDQGWYHQHYQRVELIGGGYYAFHDGYWYPAWGYSPQHEYYAYDAPIYVGHRAEPPDQVIADVQAELKEMGYYTGEVDGLLGPLTRQALEGYQADSGLQVTQVIDEPTLESLNLAS